METTPLRSDELLKRIPWPELRAIDVPPVGEGDCLIVCAGFEHRSIEALRKVRDAGSTNLSIVVIEYRPKYIENKIEELLKICASANYSVNTCVYDRANPAGMGQTLVDLLEDADRVFLDVSGMSRLLIVQSVVAIICSRCSPLSLLYTEAKEYPPSEDKIFSRNEREETGNILSYLSTGIMEIVSTPELSSVAMLGESIRLIAFPSFDPSHLGNLVNELQPTYTDLIHGIPHLHKDAWRKEAIASLNQTVIRGFRNLREYGASTLDYRETLDILLRVYSERSMFDRFVVAPTGSKMQALAIGLLRAAMDDIQIVYPIPMTFTTPEEHTVGSRQLYVLDVPGEVEELVRTKGQSI